MLAKCPEDHARTYYSCKPTQIGPIATPKRHFSGADSPSSRQLVEACPYLVVLRKTAAAKPVEETEPQLSEREPLVSGETVEACSFIIALRLSAARPVSYNWPRLYSPTT